MRLVNGVTVLRWADDTLTVWLGSQTFPSLEASIPYTNASLLSGKYVEVNLNNGQPPVRPRLVMLPGGGYSPPMPEEGTPPTIGKHWCALEDLKPRSTK
jgi:hypothetical protein